MLTQIEAEAMLREARIAQYVFVIGGAIMCIAAYLVMQMIK